MFGLGIPEYTASNVKFGTPELNSGRFLRAKFYYNPLGVIDVADCHISVVRT